MINRDNVEFFLLYSFWKSEADYLFIIHEHFDHFDTTAIQLLTGDNTQLVTNQRCAEMLSYGTVMANGDM